MINLPQFTFLCGRLGQGQIDLTKALIAENDQTIRLDFTYPIQDFLSSLFPESCPAVLDPLENLDHGLLGFPTTDARSHDFQELGSQDIKTFIACIHRGLREAFGPGALGIICLRYVRHSDLVQNFDHLLFPDGIDPADIQVFIDQFGDKNCLCIHLGSLNEQFGIDRLKCHHIWLAHSDTHNRMAQLQKDLNNDRPLTGRATGVSTGN